MEQVAEALKKFRDFASIDEWDFVLGELSAKTDANDEFCLDREVEAVLNAIIDLYTTN
jgi:hypothetical protein